MTLSIEKILIKFVKLYTMDNFNQLEIPGTDGWYHATDDGRIWSCMTGRFLKPVLAPNGYFKVELCINGEQTTHMIHRLVALTFIPKVEGRNIVDHINENKQDNRLENLRWSNHSLNHHNVSKTKGYYFQSSRNKWMSRIHLNGQTKFLGRFDTEQEARDAYLKAKSELVTF